MLELYVPASRPRPRRHAFRSVAAATWWLATIMGESMRDVMADGARLWQADGWSCDL